jgi:hypothetical protein
VGVGGTCRAVAKKRACVPESIYGNYGGSINAYASIHPLPSVT